ncbi:hypothetical protein HDU81_000085 [Chytriomyces hyalinus]|nr:hypothetical protein HDU81_000085 [Chytriomyces hyalinus]
MQEMDDSDNETQPPSPELVGSRMRFNRETTTEARPAEQDDYLECFSRYVQKPLLDARMPLQNTHKSWHSNAKSELEHQVGAASNPISLALAAMNEAKTKKTIERALDHSTLISAVSDIVTAACADLKVASLANSKTLAEELRKSNQQTELSNLQLWSRTLESEISALRFNQAQLKEDFTSLLETKALLDSTSHPTPQDSKPSQVEASLSLPPDTSVHCFPPSPLTLSEGIDRLGSIEPSTSIPERVKVPVIQDPKSRKLRSRVTTLRDPPPVKPAQAPNLVKHSLSRKTILLDSSASFSEDVVDGVFNSQFFQEPVSSEICTKSAPQSTAKRTTVFNAAGQSSLSISTPENGGLLPDSRKRYIKEEVQDEEVIWVSSGNDTIEVEEVAAKENNPAIIQPTSASFLKMLEGRSGGGGKRGKKPRRGGLKMISGLDHVTAANSPLRHRRVQSVLLFVLLVVCGTGFVLWSRGGSDAFIPTVTPVAGGVAGKEVAIQREKSQIGAPSMSEEQLKAIVEDAVRKAISEQPVGKGVEAVTPKYKPPQKDIALADLETTIDLMQARFLDFLNGEEGMNDQSTNFGVFGGSLLDQKNPFNVRTTWNRVHQYALAIAEKPEYEVTNFLQLSRRVRANQIAYIILYDKPSLITLLSLATSEKDESATSAHDQLQAELENVESVLTKLLYGWIMPRYPNIRALQKDFTAPPGNKDLDMGIVITTGQWHFELALHAIETIREVLKCDLPIEIQYAGPDDLSADMRKAFNALPNVKTVDVLDKFDSSVGITGWAIKPFAILASRFRTVIFFDADALTFQNPEKFVKDSVIFRQYGTLFYHDRTVKNGGNLEWFKGINPQNSRYSNSLRYMDDRSHNEMESGVVVVDKGRTGNLHAMLMTCKMNSKEERDKMTYNHMHGDKESFWMSWDMARVPYKFVPSYGGAVGYMNDKKHVCGGLFHTDEFQKPLWWNGGVIANKHHNKDGGFMKFEYAAFDTVGKDITWEWETPTTPFCLGPKYPEFEVLELTAKEKSDGARFVELYKGMKEAGWKAYVTKKYSVQF